MRIAAEVSAFSVGADAAAREAASGPRICLPGYPRAFLRLLDPVAAPGSIVVLEEPDLIGRSVGRQHHQDFAAVEGVYGVPYVGSRRHVALAERLHAEGPFDAVITVLEYAVAATALLADGLGLPGAGSAPPRSSGTSTRSAGLARPAEWRTRRQWRCVRCLAYTASPASTEAPAWYSSRRIGRPAWACTSSRRWGSQRSGAASGSLARGYTSERNHASQALCPR